MYQEGREGDDGITCNCHLITEHETGVFYCAHATRVPRARREGSPAALTAAVRTQSFFTTQRGFILYTADRVSARFAGREMGGPFLGRGTRIVRSAVSPSGHRTGAYSNT